MVSTAADTNASTNAAGYAAIAHDATGNVDEQLQQQVRDAVESKRFAAKYGLAKLAAQWHLAPEVCATLESMHIQSFFPVQAVAIPKILDRSNDRITDICINAPTGSGKTLVYIVPIVQRLLPRVVCRVRALIVLPSRDLAIQVHAIVQQFCRNTPLKCGLAIGQSNFAAEQAALVGPIDHDRAFFSASSTTTATGGGVSLVDILVATPGRLVDHLEQTPGFTLQHLELLVVDEADRLLNQSYQDWIPKIYASIFMTHDAFDSTTTQTTHRRQDSIDRRRIRTPLTRVLLSATLTRNPRKLAAIGMSNAELTTIGRVDDVLADNATEGDAFEDDAVEKDESSSAMYTTPSNLDERVLECDAGSKPLVLLEVLSTMANALTIVFTASIEATHRLTRLLQLVAVDATRVREYSSSLSQKQRSALVAACRLGHIDVVVCSDAMARGMDIENVANVINYDVPSFLKTYIHRVGRTARAGRAGRAVTLVKTGQMKLLTRMLEKKAGSATALQQWPVDVEHMQTLVPRYTKALEQLKATLESEKNSGKRSAMTTTSALPLQATAAVEKGEEGERRKRSDTMDDDEATATPLKLQTNSNTKQSNRDDAVDRTHQQAMQALMAFQDELTTMHKRLRTH